MAAVVFEFSIRAETTPPTVSEWRMVVEPPCVDGDGAPQGPRIDAAGRLEGMTELQVKHGDFFTLPHFDEAHVIGSALLAHLFHLAATTHLEPLSVREGSDGSKNIWLGEIIIPRKDT